MPNKKRVRTGKKALSVVTSAVITGSTLISPLTALANENSEVKEPAVYETIEEAVEQKENSVVELSTVEETVEETVEAPAVETPVMEETKEAAQAEEVEEISKEQVGLLGTFEDVFPDSALATLVARELGMWRGDHVFQWDLDNITHLRIDTAGWDGETGAAITVRNLEGLHHLTNLTSLTIANSHFTDFTDFSTMPYMPRLLTLWANRQGITSLDGLENAPNLSSLQLNHNAIEDISNLANLTNLWSVQLNNNHIRDARPLANLNRLSSTALGNQTIQLDATKMGTPVELGIYNIDGSKVNAPDNAIVTRGEGTIVDGILTWDVMAGPEQVGDDEWIQRNELRFSFAGGFGGTVTQTVTEAPAIEEEVEDEAEVVRATVTRVIDGDTIEVQLPSGQEERVRFIGVDAPEQGEAFFDEATEYVHNLLDGREVYIEREGNNRDNTSSRRLRRHVWLAEPSTDEANIRENLVGARLVSVGLANVLPNFTPRHAELFGTLLQEAQDAYRGMWNVVGQIASVDYQDEFTFELGTSKEDMLSTIKETLTGWDSRGNKVIISELEFDSDSFTLDQVGRHEESMIFVRCSNGGETIIRPIFHITGEEDNIADSVVSYRTHIQDIGWQNPVQNGETSGTHGQARRLEAIEIELDSAIDGGIEYRTHIQNIGWQDWKSDGDLSGTTGQALRLEAIEIQLTGDAAEKYDVYYRVHVQNFGWLDWAKNGARAGTAGHGFRAEAIQVVLVEKGGEAPGATTAPFRQAPTNVNYSTHIQNIGWQADRRNGAMSGTTGQARRLEAMRINLSNRRFSGNIEYRTHIQGTGWENNWATNGALSGTTGQARRLEAVQVRLTGEMAKHYDVYYRVHIQGIGWQDWRKNGETAGTTGQARRLEAIEVKLVEK